MKKSLSLFILLTVNFFLFGQDFALKVKLHPNEKLRSNNYSINSEEKLSKVNKKFKSNGLVACYPNAKNPELAMYYTIKGKGQKNEVVQELMDLGIFEAVVEEDTFKIALCPNPEPPVNDTWIAQGWANNYAMELIEANCAWSISKGSSNIYIGIADTEFEETHDDLENQITNLDGQSSNNHPHGTYVSGLAAPETNNNIGISGIGYNSSIAAHRIPHSSGGIASSEDIRNAIWNLYQDGRKIINVSWTGTGLDVAAAQEIVDNGTVLVLAAGNNANDENHKTIADIPGIILVSSVDANNEFGPTGHARNQWVDICAPGVNVTTTYPNNTYGGVWGTSGAAPQVAGTIALMLEVNPCLTPEEIELLIEQTTDPIADAAQYSGLFGAGRLNSYQAVMAAGIRDYSNTTLFGNKNLNAGYGFNLNNVSIGNSSNINLDARKEVNINGTFEVPLGSTFSIDIDSSVQTNCQ